MDQYVAFMVSFCRNQTVDLITVSLCSLYSLHAGAVNESCEGVSGRRVGRFVIVALLGHHLVQAAREHVREGDIGGHCLGRRNGWHDGLEKKGGLNILAACEERLVYHFIFLIFCQPPVREVVKS